MSLSSRAWPRELAPVEGTDAPCGTGHRASVPCPVPTLAATWDAVLPASGRRVRSGNTAEPSGTAGSAAVTRKNCPGRCRCSGPGTPTANAAARTPTGRGAGDPQVTGARWAPLGAAAASGGLVVLRDDRGRDATAVADL